MDYLRLKHGSAAVIAAGGLTTATAAYLSLPLLGLIGGSTVVLGGLGVHFFGAADERQRRRKRDGQRASSEIAMPAPPAGGETHAEIDEAAQHIAHGRPDLAIEALEKIRKRGWDRLTARERYRVVANLGNAKLEQQDPIGAGREFIRTVEYQPLDEDAQCYEALGYLFLGDRERARSLTIKISSEHPGLGRAQMIRIRTEPDQTPFDEILESVPTVVRTHPEVAVALYERAVTYNRLAEAEAILRATDLDEWTALPLALGSLILQRELARLRMTLRGPIAESPERLIEATQLFTKALGKFVTGNADAHKAYLNRGTCHRLLGNIREARGDYQKAYDLAPSEAQASLALARTAREENKLGEAVEIVAKYLQSQSSPESQALLAFLLVERELPGDLDEAEKRLANVASQLGDLEESGQRAEIIERLAEIYFRTERGEEALDLVRGQRADLLGIEKRKVIEGGLLLRLGRREEALAAARVAREALNDSSDDITVRNLAILFERLEDYSTAFTLWRSVTPPEFIAPDTLHLLHCAKEASEDSFIIAFCAQLRANKHHDQQVLGFEIETLLEYSEYSEIRSALLDYLEAKPDDKVVRLNLSAIAIQQGWNNLVVTEPERLPAVHELPNVKVGERAANVLRVGSDPLQALDYAYALYRRFPDEPAANRALIVALIFPGHEPLEIPKPEVVAAGVAVGYREDNVDETRWLVIEEDKPSLTRQEYPLSHGLTQALLDKRVGDRFRFPGSGVRIRTGIVAELRDKRVHRANELMRDWTIRFPDDFFVESIPAGEAPPEESLAEVVKVAQSVAAQSEKIEEAYAAGKIPVATFAHFAKRTVFETVRHLASQSHLKIRCCVGSKEELDDAARLLNEAARVVLDPTAIATLTLLEEVPVVSELPFRCVVTEGALQEIRHVIMEAAPSSAFGYLSAHRGSVSIQEVDQDAAAEYVERLKLVMAQLEGDCEVLGGSDLAQVSLAQRAQLLEVSARSSIEAAAAARNRNVVLWSDDLFFQSAFDDVLPTRRVWTQAVFVWADQKQLVARHRRSRATARLLRFGYVFTGSNALAVVDTCEGAQWSPAEPDAAAVLRDFGNPSWNYQTALQMTAESLMRIWREAPSEDHARAVTAALLSHLADRQDHARILRTIMDNVDALLGLAVTRAASLRDVLKTFLGTGVSPL
jgi:tetratricopeptide (TPR) repeat protein